MDDLKFEIIPAYRFKSYFKYLLFSIGLILIAISSINGSYDVLSFLGLILIIAGVLFILFTSKQYLKINHDAVEFKSKSIIKEFSQSITIKFDEVKEVYFLKRQFLLFGGRNPIADADAQTLYNENRVLFILNDNKQETIKQVGSLNDFKKAFELIKKRIEIKEIE